MRRFIRAGDVLADLVRRMDAQILLKNDRKFYESVMSQFGRVGYIYETQFNALHSILYKYEKRWLNKCRKTNTKSKSAQH
jgi:hypothetical protein